MTPLMSYKNRLRDLGLGLDFDRDECYNVKNIQCFFVISLH